MATPFSTTINLADVNTAIQFATWLQAQKSINTARLKANAAAINATIDTISAAIINGADAASLQAFMLAQITPPATTTAAPAAGTGSTTPTSTTTTPTTS